jgi:putative pyruvate formate lyase activating enzyme
VASFSIHRGEEPPISGSAGSGNIFFTGCNLACSFCQNYPISRLDVGRDLTLDELADGMLSLQRRGAHNINLVTPTPWIPQIIEATSLARGKGLSLPLVFNSGGYESLQALRLLEGIVDIYLPDMKYATAGAAWRRSRAPRYVQANRQAIAEMSRQTGPLTVDSTGLAVRGVLVRHLVLPGGLSESQDVITAMADLFPDLPLSLMFQYFPAWKAAGHPVLGRRLTAEECAEAEEALAASGIDRGWTQVYCQWASGYGSEKGTCRGCRECIFDLEDAKGKC